MKPVERSGHVDFWILIQQNNTGTFSQFTGGTSEFGPGYYKTLEQAQHHQTMERLKGNSLQVYHIEWPL